ncbi:hypothetical protein Nepgr_021664 [Nepenthes gracilis]|uniref:Uncharacterized protein n=1 Tax=Nepenthes gracilis TaxID=150966 RepID=A0AAD3SYM8_NEPGR|nr:hypothetical protein Nepgr_021664 [Nepenthes gracilis]
MHPRQIGYRVSSMQVKTSATLAGTSNSRRQPQPTISIYKVDQHPQQEQPYQNCSSNCIIPSASLNRIKGSNRMLPAFSRFASSQAAHPPTPGVSSLKPQQGTKSVQHQSSHPTQIAATTQQIFRTRPGPTFSNESQQSQASKCNPDRTVPEST